MKTLLRSALSALLLFTAFAAARADDSLLDTVLKRDKIIVATYSTSPPLAYVDDNGKLVGFEIDMAHQIAKDLLGDENKVEFVVVQSDGRFPAALSGKVDFGLCSTTIFPDRAVRIAFTRPYLDTGNSLIARKDAGIKDFAQLNDPKFTYAILNVPPAIERAKQLLPNARLLLLDSPSALFLAVKTGRATAFNIDKPIADYYEHENDDLMRLNVDGTPFAYVQQDAIFMKPGDFKWWLFLDTWVGELRSGSRYPQYVAWYQKWLHKDPPPQRGYDFNKY
ncbi:transporter substrate-binding domain-containing protein [Rhodopila sp.]|uniref:transporter substrate-binding domain-containing protein n=1 Tax=Rhodopila sp. TaxID=2480087 RepID=UPI002C2308D4|nr:transporter substrate-binding domain-containing protein [Rhodopila sp.]HVZ08432.1 transporter substrate-binding domain-containing protein [Rhodopila sp.]